MKTTIVIPAFNEGKRISKVLKSLAKTDYSVIVVDDGSSDNTSSEVKKFRKVKLINHETNRGQGAALKTGIRAALKLKSDTIITFDADGQHRASEIEKFTKKIEEGYDVVLGSRFLKKTKLPLRRKIILKGSILVERVFLGVKLTDAHNGFRAFSVKAARKIKIKEDGMAHASEIIYRIKEKDLSYCEIPVNIKYSKDTMIKGGNTFLRSIHILFQIIKMRLRNIRSFF